MPSPKILPGKHENMTAAGLRRHFEAGCRHPACTAASTAAEPAPTAPQTAPTQEPEADATPPEAVAPASHPLREFDVDLTDAMLAISSSGMTVEDAGHALSAPGPAAPRVAGRTDARGTIRRLRGLVYVGFTPVQIAQATRTNVDAVWWLLLGRVDTVTDITHARITNISRELVKEIPDSPDARSRALAVDSGWRSYFAWDSFDFDRDAA
jgi:pyruvate/2-oxoglutarate dehydrogenase complex dihydrolipoamide acyltransferase (E2) component